MRLRFDEATCPDHKQAIASGFEGFRQNVNDRSSLALRGMKEYAMQRYRSTPHRSFRVAVVEAVE